MEISLLPWLIAWAILTTIDVILAVYRAHLASHEVTGIRIEDTEADLPEVQRKSAQTFSKIDFYVKWLTYLSVLMIVSIGVMWLYQQLAPKMT